MPNIFEFQNFREYLEAYYCQKKASSKSFSYRSLSRAADSAPSFVYHVIEGKRNLTKNSIMKLSKALGHTRLESDYFENLVFFNQAKTISEKTHYYNRIAEIRKPTSIKIVDKENYEYYKYWYHSVIREVVTFFDFEGDYEKLGEFLIPSITAKQARESVSLLLKLGFIRKDKSGRFVQTQKNLQTRPSLPNSFLLEKFQMEMLEIALQAYKKFTVYDRMSSSTTFSISKETFELFKLKARDFRAELAELARFDNSEDRVYQLTINLFPVSNSTR
ncbi:MAG: TIGR02147 family protein [Fibrobacter sp.]|nr:TIGR02147 family protein [Fibrobacter sp.]